MTTARRVLATFASALVLPLVLALPAHTKSDDVWITVERAVGERVLNDLRAAGSDGALTIEGDGNVVVAHLSEADLPYVSQKLHHDLGHCGGFIAHSSRQAALNEAGRANSRQAPPAPQIAYTIDNGPTVAALLADIQETNIRSTIISLSDFFTRFHNCDTGRQSARSIYELWKGYAAGRSDVRIQPFVHTGYNTKQPSVILTIQGTTLPSEVVILGAHQDSISGFNCARSRAPGADDDGSGIAALSEVIRVAMATGYKPLRTVKFMAYAAEEIGLRGSDEIAASYQAKDVDVVGVFQLDMTNYKGSDTDIWLIGDYTNSNQNTFVGKLVDTYLPGITRSTTLCGYACSDHASWSTRGYAASFPFEASFDEYNPYIHSQQDTIDKSGNNANHAIKFSKLAASYMAELAKGSVE